MIGCRSAFLANTTTFWLDPGIRDVERLSPLLRPYPTEELIAFPVGTRVNNHRNDDPSCIEPVA